MRLRLLIAVVLMSACGFGQAARYDAPAEITTSINGVSTNAPAPSALITVCGYPATGGLPCTNKAAVCPDVTAIGCTTGAPNNPVTADAQGNFGFWISPGLYQYSICPVGGTCRGPYTAMVPFGVNSAGTPTFGGTVSVSGIILSGTATKQVSGGPEKISFQDAAANRVAIANFVGSEANARFLIDLQGNHEWGLGGANDQSTLLGISAAGRMNLSGTSGGGLNIVRWTAPGVLEAQPRLLFNNDGSGIQMSDGTLAADVRFGRSTAGLANFYGASGFGVLKETDSFQRIFLGSDGTGITFGGGSLATDVSVSRFGPGVIAIGNGTGSGNASGTLQAANIVGMRIATNFTGADIGAQVNAAFANCSNLCTVYIPAGSYSYSTAIAYPVGTLGTACLVGAGPGTTILNWTGAAGTDAITATGTGQASANVCMKDFEVVGNVNAQSGIHLKNFNKGVLSNILVQGFTATGTTAGIGILNDGDNAVTFMGDDIRGNNIGYRDVGNTTFAANAIKIIGGQVAYNNLHNVFEDAAGQSTAGPNIGNSAIGVTFEVSSTNTTDQIFDQLCTGCSYTNNYFESDSGTVIPSQIVIGDATYAPVATVVTGNTFASVGTTQTINDVNGQGTTVGDNVENGTVTTFVNQGTAVRNERILKNRATSATNLCSTNDPGADKYCYGANTGTLVNAQSASATGYAFNTVTGYQQDLAIRQRSGGTNLVNFQNSGGTGVASITAAGNILAGSTGTGIVEAGQIQNGANSAMTVPSSPSSTLTITIAPANASALGTTAIASGACAALVTAAATNVLATDIVSWSFAGDPSGVTGYGAGTGGGLTVTAFATAGNVNFRVCNLTAASITPGAISVRWAVYR